MRDDAMKYLSISLVGFLLVVDIANGDAPPAPAATPEP
jgi:hypothetical protein